jgi:triosephosphate isomerase
MKKATGRRPLIAGNWKMHATRPETTALIDGIKEAAGSARDRDVVVAPPFTALETAARAIAGTSIGLAGQNLHTEAKGAFTGEIAGEMLKDVGCGFVIVGHSERRQIHRESDELVAAKFVAVQAAGLTPILCLGETLEERDAGTTEAVVSRQLGAVLQRAGIEAFERAVVAYEPVWAIGTGRNATAEQAQSVHAFVRGVLADRNARIASSIRILYGGSVKAANAAELFAGPDVDGGLVGGASLKGEEFLAICRAAAT